MSDKRIIFNLTVEEIKELAETVRKNDLDRIIIKSNSYTESEIVIERHSSSQVVTETIHSSEPEIHETEIIKETLKSAPEPEKPKGNMVKSPIVGTFYSSPSPDKPPFVKIGDTVKKGDVIMIIESMKLMNEVQSDFDGKVLDILVENGQAVEYDQPIMIIG